jgi:uncharacterized protein with PQ loop repeat
MKLISISIFIWLCSGCVSVATSVATQAGVQLVGEQYLITQKKPIIRCNVINVIKGNKMCRVYRQYKK